jgi:class 3 adenylate cyclase
VEIQSYFHDYKVSSKEEWKINSRIGIHPGEPVHRAGDVFGDAVSIASHVEPIAPPEGVCVSQQVYDRVQNKLHIPLVSLGEKSLKNVSSPVTAYKVVMRWEKESVESLTQLDARRIAVLPFVSTSPTPTTNTSLTD